MRYLLLSLLMLQSPALLAQADSCACCGDVYRQFDFWLGSWQVFVQDSSGREKLAGTNRLVLLQDSCVIQENWVSADGRYTGTSYNFYNRDTRQWKQLWLDNQGACLELEGGLEGNDMVLRSKRYAGDSSINRIRWTPNPDGTLRQLWERSSDQGKSWQILFDGYYRQVSHD